MQLPINWAISLKQQLCPVCSVESSHSVLLWGLYKVFKSCSSHRHINSHVLFIRAGGCVCVELPSLRSTLHLHFIHTDFQLPHTHKGYERGRASEREREGKLPSKTFIRNIWWIWWCQSSTQALTRLNTHSSHSWSALCFKSRADLMACLKWISDYFNTKIILSDFFQHFYCWESSRCGNESEPCAMQRVVLGDLWRTGRSPSHKTDSSSRSQC